MQLIRTGGGLGRKEIRVAENHRQQVVEIVCEPAGENAQALHLLIVQNLELKAGYYGYRHPGMKHGPYYSPDGALQFEIRNYR